MSSTLVHIPHHYLSYDFWPLRMVLVRCSNIDLEPSTYHEAAKDPRWVLVSQQSSGLGDNGTWVVVDLPPTTNRGKTSKELKVHTHFAKLKQWITLLPVIGHLHLFSGSNLPHKTFGLLAVKYGPIFTVKFGAHQVLVPAKALAVELLGYNYAIFGLGPYGPYWREMKKIVVLELLSNHHVQMLKTYSRI
ncbi:hypothetical protein H5410_024485 [Solanum commersonii]|uniref:Uncharacterized protein n=1 Tax=Solanum commersonii TaxID=4109 RepID=A0A9J5ZM54_SOLCO|nr:hypothetical protein H5410_024485 [Solanum commersonii]